MTATTWPCEIGNGEKVCGKPGMECVQGRWRCARHMPADKPDGKCSHSLSSRGRCSFCGQRVPEGPCELFDGPLTADGYGDRGRRQARRDGLSRRAHRAVWQKAHGPIPAGLVVRHACDTPACIALAHLELGTQADNVADAVERDRLSRGEQRPSARLTVAQVIDITTRRANGERGVDLAAEFGVSPQNDLRHLPPPLLGPNPRARLLKGTSP